MIHCSPISRSSYKKPYPLAELLTSDTWSRHYHLWTQSFTMTVNLRRSIFFKLRESPNCLMYFFLTHQLVELRLQLKVLLTLSAMTNKRYAKIDTQNKKNLQNAIILSSNSAVKDLYDYTSSQKLSTKMKLQKLKSNLK